MARKDGLYSLRHTAYDMCKYLFRFGPVIRLLYPENATLIALLDTAEAVCHELVLEIDKQRPQGV